MDRIYLYKAQPLGGEFNTFKIEDSKLTKYKLHITIEQPIRPRLIITDETATILQLPHEGNAYRIDEQVFLNISQLIKEHTLHEKRDRYAPKIEILLQGLDFKNEYEVYNILIQQNSILAREEEEKKKERYVEGNKVSTWPSYLNPSNVKFYIEEEKVYTEDTYIITAGKEISLSEFYDAFHEYLESKKKWEAKADVLKKECNRELMITQKQMRDETLHRLQEVEERFKIQLRQEAGDGPSLEKKLYNV